MLDYYLPSAASSVGLEIFEVRQNGAQQDLVRKFSSEDASTVKRPPMAVAERWFMKPEVLGKTAGMHRFVWDLAWKNSGGPTADEDDENHIPSGPKAAPGMYDVRLTVDGKTQTQRLKLIMDPRSPATEEVLAQQLQLAWQIFGETVEARRALAEIASVQKQIADLQTKLGKQNARLLPVLAEAQTAISKIVTKPEHTGLSDANTSLASALRVVEEGDRATPSQAVAVYEESSPRVKAGIAEWDQFKQTKLPEINRQLHEAGLAPVAMAEIEEQVEFLVSR
jgi:hypothetical protein